MKRLVIFDLDGTLVNTIDDLGGAANHVLSLLGFPLHTTEEYKKKVGNGINKLLLRSLPDSIQDKEAYLDRMRGLFIPYYDAHNTDLSHPYEGICELLRELQEKGYMMAVASNKYISATRKIIHELFPQIHFVEVLGQREGIPTKPDTRIVQDILLSSGATAEETLYVGDTMVDGQTAMNSGIDFCAVSWGFRPESELQTASPLFVVHHPREILEHLERL